MKKYIFLASVLMAGVVAYAANIAGDAVKAQPANIRVVKLGACNGGQYDTIKTTKNNTYGAFNLGADYSRAKAKYIRCVFNAGAFAAADSLYFQYQCSAGSSILDTSAGWSYCDTLYTAKVTNTVDITAKTGAYIWFRLLSAKGTTIVLQQPVRVVIEEPMSDQVFQRQ